MSAQAGPLPEGVAPHGEHLLLDNRATPCAVGLIRAARAIRAMEPGAVLEIWTRDRVAPVEIPVWVEREGHQIVRQERSGRWPRGWFVFEVRRAG